MKILQVTNYPTVNPMHGGQIRAAEIAKALRDAGHDVESFSVYIQAYFSEAQASDLPLALDARFFTEDLDFLSDYMTGVDVMYEASLMARVKARVTGFDPDVIVFEQPWLYRAVAAAAREGVCLVYSSHNIEWRLKENIARARKVDAGAHVQAIRTLEAEMAQHCDLVVACTAKDAEELDGMATGSWRKQPTVVCGNGVEPFSCSPREVLLWRSRLTEVIGSPYPVFVSSGHQPNADGFWELMAPGLTFLRPNEEVLVIGGVCGLLTKSRLAQPFLDLNLSRLHLAGTRPKRELQAMVRSSQVVLLPISSGEGSNLKTAEALESGCAIVATAKAFRGFEAAMDLPHVSIAESATEFRSAVRRALDSPPNATPTPASLRSQYHWSATLQPLVEWLGASRAGLSRQQRHTKSALT